MTDLWDEVKVFVKERDEMLLACDIDKCISFYENIIQESNPLHVILLR